MDRYQEEISSVEAELASVERQITQFRTSGYPAQSTMTMMGGSMYVGGTGYTPEDLDKLKKSKSSLQVSGSRLHKLQMPKLCPPIHCVPILQLGVCVCVYVCVDS
jgi:hypothetical protein